LCYILAAPTTVTLTVDNMGNKDLYKYTVRAIGATGVGTDESAILNLAPLDRTAATTYTTIGGKGVISKVEVYPITSRGICQGQLTSTSIVPVC